MRNLDKMHKMSGLRLVVKSILATVRSEDMTRTTLRSDAVWLGGTE